MTCKGRLSEMDDKEWDLLAYDFSDMLSRFEYPIDVCETAIRPNLPAFIEACLATQAELDKKEA
jgi:hypothetical protein